MAFTEGCSGKKVRRPAMWSQASQAMTR